MADDDALEPYREFIREITLRFERAMRSLAGELREESRATREEIRTTREESRAYFEMLYAEGRELRDESRAQTQALLRVIDRLDNGGPAPAA